MVQMIQNLEQKCIFIVFIDLHNFLELGQNWPKSVSKTLIFRIFALFFWSRSFYGKLGKGGWG